MVDDNMEIKKSNPNEKKFTTSEFVLFVIASLLIGISIGNVLYSNKTTKEVITNKNLQELVENYQYIVNNYFEEVDESELVSGAIDGMMQTLDDPYSVYMDDIAFENFSITLDGSYQGIGIQASKNNETGNILIVSVFKGSPADLAGLLAGDEIIAINNEKVNDYTVEEFSQYIKTSDKKKFLFKIIRNGETLNIDIDKNLVVLNSIESKTFSQEKIGYIYIGIFANNTYEQFKSALEKFEKQQIKSLIIDVRGNSGGHLTAVDSILDLFLTKQHKMYGFSQNGKTVYTYGTGNEEKKYEIVLLGDENSASASEVLIAGLSENLNSKFFGIKTYGKGTVQELVGLSDGSQYKITTKKWLTPKGNWINDTKGILPDKEVKIGDKYYETLSEEDDLQLKFAIDYLNSNIK